MIRRTSILAALALLVALSATPGTAQVDTGRADFSNYVALGDSLTGAIVSGGWLDTFQRNSYPALISRQATGGTADFQQPLISSPGITPPMELVALVPPTFDAAPGLGSPINLQLPRPYNNLGIPGARVGDTLRTVTDGGGTHDIVLRGQGTALQQALVSQPTFVSLWIGNNDALAAATSGIVIDGVTLTTAADFENDFRDIASLLSTTGAEMLFVNVPDVTVIPFVSTLAPVLVNPATNQPVVGPDGSLVPLLGPDGPLALNDNVLLTAGGFLAQGFGIPVALGGNGQPLPNSVVLSASETNRINDRVAQYNNIIAQVASEVGAALYDFNGSFGRIDEEGLDIAGITYTTSFLTGGLFSYDGVHATPFGYAFVANEMIEVINDAFDASIPKVGLGPYVFGPLQLDPRPVVFQAARAVQSTRVTEQVWSNLRWLGFKIPSTLADSTPPDDDEPGDGGGGVQGPDGGPEPPEPAPNRPGRPGRPLRPVS